MNYIRLILSFLLLVVAEGYSQDDAKIKSIFDNIENYYSNQTQFSYNINYKFYKSKSSTSPDESYQGMIIKLNNVNCQRMKDIDMLDFGDKSVVVNDRDKIINVTDVKNVKYPVLIKAYLNIFTKYKVIEEKNRYICVLSEDIYNNTKIKSIKVYVNKTDYSLQKQVFQFLGDESQSPRLEVLFSKRILESSDYELVKKSRYYKISGGKIVASERYKNYQLVVN